MTEAGPKDGPVIVLLHGMGFPAPFMWATLAPHLRVSHRLIAPDTIGDVGKSLLDGDTKAPRSGVDYSHWLGDVLERVAIGDGKVAIVGTSYGARLALHYCLNVPSASIDWPWMSPLGIAPWSVLAKLMLRMTCRSCNCAVTPMQVCDGPSEIVIILARLSLHGCTLDAVPAELGPPLPL